MRWKPLGSTCRRNRRMNSAASSVMVLSRSRPLIRPTTIMDVAMVWRRAVFGHRFRRRSRRRPCPPISGPSHRPCLIRTSRRARGLFLPPSSRYPRLGPQALAQQRPRSSRQRRLSRQPLPREPSRKAPRLNRWLLRPRPPRAANRRLRPSRFRRTPPHRPRPRSRQRRRLSRRLLRLEPSRKAPRLIRWLLRPRPPRAANRRLRPSRFRHTPPHRPTGCQRRRLSRQLLPREPSRKAPRLNRWLLRRRPPWVANRYLRPSRFRRIPPHRPRSCQRRRLSRQLLLREPSRKATRRRPCQSNRNPLLSSTHRRLRQLSAHHRRLRRPFMRRRLRKPFTRLHPRPRPAAR